MDEHDLPLIVPSIERTAHAVSLWLERALPDLRLTQAEAHVLAHLARRSPCSINDLHHSFGHKRSTLTSLLDRLGGRGWIRRAPHPDSRRLVLVELTPAGRQVAERVAAALRDLEERTLARADADAVAGFRWVVRALEEGLSHDG